MTSTCTDVAGNTATDSRTVAASTQADVQVKLTGPATGSKNTAYSYTFTVNNAGPRAASNVVSTLLLPTKGTLVSASPSAVKVGRLLTWTSPSLAPGASVTFSVTLKFSANGTWALRAASRSLPTSSAWATPDPRRYNNVAAVRTRIL